VTDGNADDRLNGWKEIARYLGKGVRTVQRWEKQLGLPVRRLGGEGGEIVFAYRSEISRWSEDCPGRDRLTDEQETAANHANGREAVVAQDVRRVSVRRWFGWSLSTFIVSGAVLSFYWLAKTSTASFRQPETWHVTGATVSVRDGAGSEIWHHGFGSLLNEKSYNSRLRYSQPVVIHDLDGDGLREVLFGILPVQGGLEAGLVAFNSNGSIRFRWSPDQSVRFGSQEYAGPWRFHRMFVIFEDGRRPSIWAVFIHGMMYPSVLVELDSQGNVRSRYWSNGYVEAVATGRLAGRNLVFVGATNNESRGASLAVFDRDNVKGAPPAASPEYRCLNCDDGAPTRFVTFPRRCLGREVGGTAFVQQIWADQANRVNVLVAEGEPDDQGGYAGTVWYLLDQNLAPVSAEITASARRLHRQLEAAGRLDHPFGAQDRADVFPVMSWSGDRFVALPPGKVLE